jgi:hypothetical protein
LEIIGNSKDLEKLQKHLRKMFAGLALLECDAGGEAIVAMQSAEGERVALVTPVSLKNAPKVHEWLTRVESGMREALAVLLRDCMLACAQLDLRNAEQVCECARVCLRTHSGARTVRDVDCGMARTGVIVRVEFAHN